MKIVADDKIPFLKGVLEKYAEVFYMPGDLISNTDLKNADALITRSITQCNEELLSGTSVKFIATATIGEDHIDKDYCKKNNITWTSAKGCNTAAVEQYFTAALLALTEKYNIELTGKTIGIIGVGNVGKKIQKVSKLLGLNVLLNDPPRERAEGVEGFSTLKDIQDKADIITIHTPLNYGGADKTFHLADQTFFDDLKKPIIFINTSRGAVVDSSALKTAIENGAVKNTILDVWEGEPEIDIELLKSVDIATPHIAGYSLEGKANGTSMVVTTVSDFFKLELNNWKPEIPQKATMLVIDSAAWSDQVVLQKVFEQVYPIYNDDADLREKPAYFEQLRRNYNYRRENDTLRLQLTGTSEKTKNILKELGFKFFEINNQ
jgi:erythronate-4-phosphate dehydrogenase